MFLVGLLYWLLKLSNMFSYWSSAYFSLQLMLAASALHYIKQVFLVSGETFSHINPRNTSMEFHLWSLAKLTVLIIITRLCFQINWSSCSPPPSPSWPQAPESWWLKPVGLANILFPSKSSLPSPLPSIFLDVFHPTHFTDTPELLPFLWSTVWSTWLLLLVSLGLVS